MTKKKLAKKPKKRVVKRKSKISRSTKKAISIKATKKKTASRRLSVVKKKPAARVQVRAFKPTRHVAVFGGTFNPIHYGHLNTIEILASKLDIDEIFVMPTMQNPLREPIEGPTPEDRIEMLKRALSTLPDLNIPVTLRDDELKRSGPSYTIDSIRELQKDFATTGFTVVLGADQIEHLPRWKEVNSLLQSADIVFTSRPGFDLPKSKLELPELLRKVCKRFSPDKMRTQFGTTISFLTITDVQVSATDIRRRMRSAESVVGLLPQGVIDYIKEKKLYEVSNRKVGDYADFTKFCAEVLNNKGALSLAGYDLRALNQTTEFTLIGSGTSTRHTKALAEHITKEVKQKYGLYPMGSKGTSEGRWVIVDYGSLMIHLFYDYVRNEYRIEDLWREGRRLNI